MNHSTAKLLAIIEEAELADATLRRLLEPFEISVEEFKDAESLFSLKTILAVFRVLVAHINRPGVVFRAGKRFRFADFGIFGLAVMSQPDMRAAVEFMMYYRPLSSPIIGIDVRQTETETQLVFNPLPEAREDSDIYSRLLDFNIAMFLSLIADGIGRDDAVKKITLSARADAITHDLMQGDGHIVETGAPEDMVCLKPWAMSTPLRQKSTIGAARAKKLCSDALSHIAGTSRFAREVQAVIIANIERPLTAAFVARRLGMSERSLRRQLSEEDVSFRALKSAMQDDVACRYLRETRMTVEDIATAVGYGDVSNFRRAFRARHGQTPHAYRSLSIG